MTERNITVTFETNSKVAWALAQFLKRVDYAAIKDFTSDDEADLAWLGVSHLQRGLEEAGFKPR
jgi:hypothetical protein